MKNAEEDIFGFFETQYEYYTGQSASLLTDDQLAMKIAHLSRIREMEAEQTISNQLQAILNGQRT